MREMLVDKGPGYPFAQPGDIFFTRGVDTLGKLIRWAEREKDEAESWANHVGGITEPGFLVPPVGRITALARASEALWKIKDHIWWNAHNKNQGYAVAVFRPRRFNGNDGVERVVNDWRSRTGNTYGWWRLFTFLLERLTSLPFTKLHYQDTRIVCSNHIALGLEKDGIRINNHDPNELDPDEFLDYCASHPEEFQFVGWGIVPGPAPE
jgi:hypothetical protein